MGSENLGPTEPYKGLRPYEEQNRDIFFGREEERDILIDKLYSNKLTLLFAGTGVGKSSLLRAAVMPKLKQPERENLDVVCYSDWVTGPLAGLKKETIRVLRERGKIRFDFRVDEDISLKEFFNLCATFASEPLVVMLDQFEEFFQYQRYKEDFLQFVEALSQCVKDRETPTVFLISMREDFALELNVFKDYLPTTLFDNFFRLEKLTEEKAREAIRKPVEDLGFLYEEELTRELLTDLSDREKESRMDKSPVRFFKGLPAYVEPPYLQIVCTQLWEEEKQNPEGKIRFSVYKDRGRARGFVNSYFNNMMATFSPSEKKIASLAFNHLVTPRGTKMAYPVKDLANLLRVNHKDLENVLEKLAKSRVLRSQKRENEVWYELYHDIFTKIIYKWNEKFKTKQRVKRASFISAVGILACFVLYFLFDVIINSTSHYLRLSSRAGISDTIEIYRGRLKSTDILNLKGYKVESIYRRNQVEPDKRFEKKQVAEYNNLNVELIGLLPIVDRISTYWEAGEIDKALDLAENSISKDNIARSEQVIDLLAGFRSGKSYKILKKYLKPTEDTNIRKKIIQVIAAMEYSSLNDDLAALLNDPIDVVKNSAAVALARIGSDRGGNRLIEMLEDYRNTGTQTTAAAALAQIGSYKAEDAFITKLRDWKPEVRSQAAESLGRIGSDKAVAPLTRLLVDKNQIVRNSAGKALLQIDSDKAVDFLIQLLTHPDANVRSEATNTLGEVKSVKAVEPLIAALKDQVPDVRSKAADALGEIKSDKAVDPLIDALKDKDNDKEVRIRAVVALGQIGSDKAVEPLIDALKDKDVRRRAAYTLGQIGSDKAIEPLIAALKDFDLSFSAAYALGQIADDKAVDPLIAALNDQDTGVRENAAFALGQIGGDKAVGPLIDALKDRHQPVRTNAAVALGKIGSNKAADPLIDALEDQDLDVVYNAASALGRIGSLKAIGPLNRLLRHSNPKIKLRAACSLDQIGSDKAESAYIQLIKDQDVMDDAIEALGLIGSEEAESALIGVLENQDPKIRKRAAESLTFVGGEKAGSALSQLINDQDPKVRENTARALALIGRAKAVTPMIQLLKNQDSTVRSDAAYFLEFIGSAKAVTPLVQLLKDQDSYMRSSAAEALGSIGSDKAVTPLVQLLKDHDSSVRRSAAEALGSIGSDKAVEHLTTLLNDDDEEIRKRTVINLGNLSAAQKADKIKNLFKDQKETKPVKLAAAATLLKLEDDQECLKYLEKKALSDDMDERADAAEILGEVPSKKGISLLKTMVKDNALKDNLRKKIILSLVRSNDKSAAAHLPNLYKKPSIDDMADFLEDASEAPPVCFDFFKSIVLNTRQYFPVRRMAIMVLGRIKHKDAVTALYELLKNENEIKESEILQYITIVEIGNTLSLHSLPGDLLIQLKNDLKERLKKLEDRKEEWRKIRDENTEAFSKEEEQQKMDEWRKRLKEVEPKEFLEFQLAYAISRIDPENDGIDLLSHDLANVREGAWMGIGTSKNVSLIEKLYRMRKKSDIPWFRHAAYRAIDHILIEIEVFGNKKELKEVETLFNKLTEEEGKNFHEGVQTRMQWTVDRLKDSIIN